MRQGEKDSNSGPLEGVKERVHAGLRWLSVAEAAYYLGIAPGTLYNWISAGRFPVKPKAMGKLRKFDRQALDAYMEGLEEV
jgi:excisionase family DNA binding protein